MDRDHANNGSGYDAYIARALATDGGHLMIGRGGFTLWFDQGCFLSGYDSDAAKAEAIAAGLPVIDSREVPFAVVARLAVSGPMVAVGEPADPAPRNALSVVPLREIAAAYRAAGAEVVNLDATLAGSAEPGEERTSTDARRERTYHGRRDAERACHVLVIEPDGWERPLDPRLDLENKSPTGFAWGYAGSGPAQLSLAVCADALGDDAEALACSSALSSRSSPISTANGPGR